MLIETDDKLPDDITLMNVLYWLHNYIKRYVDRG